MSWAYRLILQVINNPSHRTNLTGWQQTFTNLYRLTTNLHRNNLTSCQQTFTWTNLTGWQLVKLFLWRFVENLFFVKVCCQPVKLVHVNVCWQLVKLFLWRFVVSLYKLVKVCCQPVKFVLCEGLLITCKISLYAHDKSWDS